MNSVFKFYYQGWLLFALGAALALGQIVGRMAKFDFSAIRNPFAMWSAPQPAVAPAGATPTGHMAAVTAEEPGELPLTSSAMADDVALAEWPEITAQPERSTEDAVVGLGLRGAWLGITIFLLLASSIFLFEGTQARLQDRTNWGDYQQGSTYIPRTPVNPLPAVPSLDGFAYMHSWYPGDADAITWMNEHISGTPTVLEASQNLYQWYGRVAIYTGLPEVTQWGGEDGQQRYPADVATRQQDVNTMYTSGDPALVLSLLQRYHVRYVYDGEVECLAYGLNVTDLTQITPTEVATCLQANNIMGPLTVFQQLVNQNVMHVVYQKEGVTLYAMN